jgi:hypothetical protein
MHWHPVMSPFFCPASGSAAQAMCKADAWVVCWKHSDRAEGFDQTQDLQDVSCVCGTVTQHVVSTTYTTVQSAQQLRATASGTKWGRQQ